MLAMDKVLSDYDLEAKRLNDALEITRLPKLKSRKMLNSVQNRKQSIQTKYIHSLNISTQFH